MPKKPLQDIVPKPSVPRRVQREEEREVSIPPVVSVSQKPEGNRKENVVSTYREEMGTTSHTSSPESDMPERTESRTRRARAYSASKRRFPWLMIGGIGVAGLVVVILLLSFVFAGASITVSPRHQDAFINGDFIATQENVPGQLQFKTAAVEKTTSKEVPATKSEDVAERATGKITIYNNFDDKPQRLITNTRFETEDGKIFRIRDSLTVPGRTMGSDGTAVPGSIEATVTADQPGTTYNVGPSKFTIPGFEGTPRYEGFYANSKEPMTGGFEGKRNTIDDTQLSNIQNELETSLKTDLIAQAGQPGQVPDGFYTFDGAYFYEFEALPIENEGNNVKIQVKGTLHNVLFDHDQFAGHLASAAIAGYDNTSIALENPADLKVTVAPIEEDLQKETPWQNTTIKVHVEGTGKFVWQFDEEQLKKDLAGKEKAALPTILKSYPSIQKAEITVRPFWKSTFPDTIEKIAVTKSLD